jgi:hypothetical protein
MTQEDLLLLKDVLTEKINRINPQLFEKHPIDKLVTLFDRQFYLREYSYLSNKVLRFNRSLIKENRQNKQLIGTYYNLILITCIYNSKHKIDASNFSPEIIREYEIRFNRIIKKISTQIDDNDYQPLKDDKYLKNLAICRLHFIPLGAQYIEAGNISRMFLLLQGLPQFLKGMKIIARLGGFSPYYKLTTNQLDPELISNFNSAGWDKLLVLTGELMKKDKSIKGLTGRSWFFDPKLELLDPDIAYIRQKFIRAGADFFYHRAEDQVIKDAIFINQKRKNLFIAKIYHPRSYLMILPRERLLRYLESHP